MPLKTRTGKSVSCGHKRPTIARLVRLQVQYASVFADSKIGYHPQEHNHCRQTRSPLLEANIKFDLQQQRGQQPSWKEEATDRFLRFAISKHTSWPATFRDLNPGITRIATLAPRVYVTREIGDDASPVEG